MCAPASAAMQLVRAFLVAAVVAVPWIAGCSAEEVAPERTWDDDLKAGGSEGKSSSCAPQTCASAGKTCGTHDDGCGGQIDCGKCVDNECTPTTCADLGKTCGNHDDGCGGILECGGVCATCTPDAKAGNASADKASDLGAMTDSPTTIKKIDALMVGEAEDDWFKFKVSDKGFGGNPLIKASVGSAPLEVSAFYLCDSAANTSSCPVEGETADATVGKGCKGRGTATVWSNCDGLTEDGTGFIRVRKAAGAQQCVSYSLDIKIEQKLF